MKNGERKIQLGFNCKNDCTRKFGAYKGMPVTRYSLHDQCHTCEVWYPKGAYQKCPCCKSPISVKPRKKYKSKKRQLQVVSVNNINTQ